MNVLKTTGACFMRVHPLVGGRPVTRPPLPEHRELSFRLSAAKPIRQSQNPEAAVPAHAIRSVRPTTSNGRRHPPHSRASLALCCCRRIRQYRVIALCICVAGLNWRSDGRQTTSIAIPPGIGGIHRPVTESGYPAKSLREFTGCLRSVGTQLFQTTEQCRVDVC